MGIFDFLKRKPAAPPADLRSALIQAVSREDWKTFSALCEQHEQAILDAFPAWRQVPDAIRNNPAAQNEYVQGLVAVAQAFENAGHPQLMALLTGNNADNPMVRWQEELAAAQASLDNGQPQEARTRLEALLKAMESNQGSGVEHYRPRVYGMLGMAHLRSGDAVKARDATQRALALCEAAGDAEGVRIYTANLQHIEDGASVVFKDAAGSLLSKGDLQQTTGRVNFEVIGSDNIPNEAERLHQEAREAGGASDYPRALALLQQAVTLAPRWPYPVYDMAYTYLLMQDFANALRYYQQTVALAPRGFFTAITAVATLEREQTGDLPPGTYFAYVALEWLDDVQKANIVRQMVVKLPHFAPAWKELALIEETPAARRTALTNGLNANPDAETKGVLQLNLALLMHEEGQHAEAVALLGQLAVDPESTFGTVHMAKATLANLV